jgi:hypothetical protein
MTWLQVFRKSSRKLAPVVEEQPLRVSTKPVKENIEPETPPSPDTPARQFSLKLEAVRVQGSVHPDQDATLLITSSKRDDENFVFEVAPLEKIDAAFRFTMDRLLRVEVEGHHAFGPGQLQCKWQFCSDGTLAISLTDAQFPGFYVTVGGIRPKWFIAV